MPSAKHSAAARLKSLVAVVSVGAGLLKRGRGVDCLHGETVQAYVGSATVSTELAVEEPGLPFEADVSSDGLEFAS